MLIGLSDVRRPENRPIAGFCIWFIAIDIVSGKPEHNLANDDCFARILGLINSLRIHGWVIGPPCETWTAIRFLEMLASKGPRPLRSASSPWALPNLSRREFAQLGIGNSLLRVALTLCVESLGRGMSGLVEHPEEPANVSYPSI